MDRYWDENTKVYGVAGSNPTRDKLFAKIMLLFNTKQYKNNHIANSVYYGISRYGIRS